jgi:hypothetical protein
MISWSLKPFVACRSNWLKGQTVPVIAQASTAEPAPAVLNFKELSGSSPSSASLAHRRTLPLATMETAY